MIKLLSHSTQHEILLKATLDKSGGANKIVVRHGRKQVGNIWWSEDDYPPTRVIVTINNVCCDMIEGDIGVGYDHFVEKSTDYFADKGITANIKIQKAVGVNSSAVPVDVLSPNVRAQATKQLESYAHKQLEVHLALLNTPNRYELEIEFRELFGKTVAYKVINALPIFRSRIDSYKIPWIVMKGKEVLDKSGWRK